MSIGKSRKGSEDRAAPIDDASASSLDINMEVEPAEARRKTSHHLQTEALTVCAIGWKSDISDEPAPLIAALASHHKGGRRTLRQSYSLRDAEKLGSGGMGSCRTVRRRGTNQIYALKTVFAEDKQMLEEMRQECAIQRSLDHPNIVRVYESFEAEADAVHIVMELCSGGNLVERLRASPRGLEERAAAELTLRLLSAVLYIHQRGYVHRDIKLDNIMFENRLPGAEPKLIDFGFACKVTKGAEQIHGRYGTLSYMAPELLDTKEKGPYESSVDLWSVGVTLYTLLSGRKPFDHEDREAKKLLIREGAPSYSGARWARVSPQAIDFVKCLMRKEPRSRLSASQALRHPWFSTLDVSPRTTITLRAPPMMLSTLMVQSLQAFASASLFTRMALEVVAFTAAPQLLREARAVFSSLDSDCSGTISRLEFVAAFAHHREVLVGDVHDIFDEVDLNHSGSLELNEFCAALVQPSLRSASGTIATQLAFQLLDADRDERLTLHDLQAVLGASLGTCSLLNMMRSVGTVYDRISCDDFRRAVLGQGLLSARWVHSPGLTRTSLRCKSTPHERSRAEAAVNRPPSRPSSTTDPLDAFPSRSPLRPSHLHCKVELNTPALRRFLSEP